MKLFTPNQAAQQNLRKTERESARAVELQTLIVQKYRELDKATQDFDAAMQRNRNQWSAEQQEHESKVAELQRIVNALEERRRQALIPLTERRKELDTKHSALEVREREIRAARAELEELSDVLSQRLDEVSERATALDDLSQSLTSKGRGLMQQVKEMEAHSKNFTAWMNKETLRIAEEKREIEKQRLAIQTKESNLLKREKLVNDKESSFEAREVALVDRYKELEYSIAEAKQKYGIK